MGALRQSLIALSLLCLSIGPSWGETALRGSDGPEPAGQDARQTELRGIEGDLKASEEQRQKLQADIETARTDREKFNTALIDANAKVQANETSIHTMEVRLETMKGSEEAIRLSLEKRRGLIGDVLAALQRMGRSPPPAILVRPEDMLGAVRTAMMLGAVLPDLKAETDALAGDLGELVRLKADMSSQKAALDQQLAQLKGERDHLAELVAARQASLDQAQGALAAEQARAAELAQKATSLKDLISQMEIASAAAAKAADEARQADAAQQARLAALEAKHLDFASLPPPFRDKSRTAPAMPFAAVKGMLPQPAVGEVIRAFGAPDGMGGSEKGISLATRAGATVASPTDGWISFAGPFRSYGQLLIINAGGGYYILLAGMDKINVHVGQFVLVGEPVGTMGDGSAKAASNVALGASGPILYVEFRKDGSSIDPGPWWAKSDMEKVRG